MPLQKAVLKDKVKLTEDVIELKFENLEPLVFKSGQYISIKVTDEIGTPLVRAYSIASAPQKDQKTFHLCLKVMPDGRATKWLDKLNKGGQIEFLGPLGNFVFQNKSKNATFIATGTGIAPFKAMIEEELEKGFAGQMQLLFGVRHIKDVFYQKFFQKLADKYSNFKFTFTLSRPENENWRGQKGRVTEILQKTSFDEEKKSDTDFYLCGLKDMVDEVSAALKENGVKSENVYFEKYN